MLHAPNQGHLHLQGKCGRMCELQCTGMGCIAPAPTITWHSVFKEGQRTGGKESSKEQLLQKLREEKIRHTH